MKIVRPQFQNGKEDCLGNFCDLYKLLFVFTYGFFLGEGGLPSAQNKFVSNKGLGFLMIN